jgi:hypothetical protein
LLIKGAPAAVRPIVIELSRLSPRTIKDPLFKGEKNAKIPMGLLRKSRTKEDEQALTAQAGSKADASRQGFPRLGEEIYAAIADHYRKFATNRFSVQTLSVCQEINDPTDSASDRQKASPVTIVDNFWQDDGHAMLCSY